MAGMASDMIREHLDHLVASGLAHNTVHDAGKLLRRVDADLPYGLPTALPDELTAWLAQTGWCNQTRKTYRDHLVRFYRWAADPRNPRIDYDPADNLRAPHVAPRLPRPATNEQVCACLTCTIFPWRLHCIFAAYAGLRPCEISRLRREDVDEQWVWVHLGKGGRSRRVPTHTRVWAAVAPLPPGPLTWRPDGCAATPKWVSQRTAEVLRRRYRIAVTLGNLRHWYATTIQEAQGNDRVTQELMGHSSLTTTARYTQVSDIRLRAAIDALPAF